MAMLLDDDSIEGVFDEGVVASSTCAAGEDSTGVDSATIGGALSMIPSLVSSAASMAAASVVSPVSSFTAGVASGGGFHTSSKAFCSKVVSVLSNKSKRYPSLEAL